MPPVYTFSRSDAEIRDELMKVFSSGCGTAREQWALQAEMLVEPVGWDALWKLSKEFCKKFRVRFPCIAFISVSSVDFEGLTANIEVLSVQHEAVSLPESVEDVPLVELWPTIKQREQCVNAATTAEFIDLMRFFYTNIWMPWDDQDDKVVLSNTIEDRMQLFTELHNGQIPTCVARSIVLLRNSAIDAFEKLKELDSSLCEEDLADEDDSLLPPNYIAQCAEMTARLDSHMSQWTLYEKSLIRDQYVAKLKNKFQKNRGKNNVVVLWQGGTVQEFQQLSQYVMQSVDSQSRLCIAEDAERALRLEPARMVISGKHAMPETPLAGVALLGHNDAELISSDVRSCLLMLSENCEMRDILVRSGAGSTALVMRGGRLRATRCRLTDDAHTHKGEFAQGIVAMAGAQILLEDCTFENFYTGIVVHKGAQVELRNCTIRNCGVGIQMYSGSSVRLDGTAVTACTENALRREFDCEIEEVNNQELQIMSNCTIGSGNLKKDVLVVKQDVDLC